MPLPRTRRKLNGPPCEGRRRPTDRIRMDAVGREKSCKVCPGHSPMKLGNTKRSKAANKVVSSTPLKTRDRERIRASMRAVRLGVGEAVEAGCLTWVATNIAFNCVSQHLDEIGAARTLMNGVRADMRRWLKARDLPIAYVENFERSKLDRLHIHGTWAVPKPDAAEFRDYFEKRVVARAKPGKDVARPIWWSVTRFRNRDGSWGQVYTLHGKSVWRRVAYTCKWAVPTGETVEGVKGGDPEKHGAFIPIRGQTLTFIFDVPGRPRRKSAQKRRTVRMMLAEGTFKNSVIVADNLRIAAIAQVGSRIVSAIAENGPGSIMFRLRQIGRLFRNGDE
jgi:hypothetical protein